MHTMAFGICLNNLYRNVVVCKALPPFKITDSKMHLTRERNQELNFHWNRSMLLFAFLIHAVKNLQNVWIYSWMFSVPTWNLNESDSETPLIDTSLLLTMNVVLMSTYLSWKNSTKELTASLWQNWYAILSCNNFTFLQ